MSITDWVIELYDSPSYEAGRQAYRQGKHLIVPVEHDREAWILGWNDEWLEHNERTPE